MIFFQQIEEHKPSEKVNMKKTEAQNQKNRNKK